MVDRIAPKTKASTKRTVPVENGQQFLMRSNPYRRRNAEKTRLAGLILDVKGNMAAFLYNRKVYVMPFAFFTKFDGITTNKGDWIAFNFKWKNRLSTMYDVINPGTPPFPATYTEKDGLQVTTTVVKRDKWVYRHKEVYEKMENGEYEKRIRYPNLIWSDAFDFISDPNRLFTKKRGEKAMKVLSKVFFDWVAFEKYNRFYSDVSKFLTVEPLELLGLADDPAVVLYSPWQIAANRVYKRTNFGPRQPERLFLEKVNPKSRYFGIVIGEGSDHFVVWDYRCGQLPSMYRYQVDEEGYTCHKPSPPVGTFVSYCVAQCLDSVMSFEAAKVEIYRSVHDVKILIHDGKPIPLVALDIVLPIDFVKGSYTIYHPFIGPMKVYHYQIEKDLAAKKPDLTMMDLRGREIRIWVQPSHNTAEADDPWETEFWRFTELDCNLFNKDVCRM